MGKKRKKSAHRDSIKGEKERPQAPKGLLGMKLAEALAKKELEASSEEKIPKSSSTGSERANVSEQKSSSSSWHQEEELTREKSEDAPDARSTQKRPRYRVYIPEKKTSETEAQPQPSKPATQPKVDTEKSTVPQKRVSAERIERSPTESWHPVSSKEKIHLKTSRSSKKPKSSQEGAVYNRPTSWQVEDGHHSDERDIVIGFDLGTACSKVTLQDKQLKRAFAVPFDGISYKANRYLLPTKLFVDPQGELSFLPVGTEVNDLKVRFVEDPEQVAFQEKNRGGIATAFDFLAAYIGLTLREVRKWFIEQKGLDYARSLISWELNLGIPSRDYEDDRLVKAMKTVALTGWNLTLAPFEEINLGSVKKARKIAEEQIDTMDVREGTEQIHPDNVTVIPEIIAEVIGYSRSPMRRNGMYLLVDVGASTLDVSTFILTEEDNEDSYPILFADIGRLGGYELHKKRVNKMVGIIESKLCSLSESCDGISPLPEREEYFPELTEKDHAEFSNSDASFRKGCSLLLRRVVGMTKKKRNPRSAEWEKGLPVFLCGGGSQIPLYRDAIKDAFNALEPLGVRGFSFVPLPKPENLETDDIPPADFHRVSVSYGLSFSELDIGKIIPQKELDDIEELRPILELEDLFIDKDKV